MRAVIDRAYRNEFRGEFPKLLHLLLELFAGTRAFEAAVDSLHLVVSVDENSSGVSEEIIQLAIDLFFHVRVIKTATEEQSVSKPEAVSVKLQIFLSDCRLIADLE